MTPLQRYIAEEIATDHVDGLDPDARRSRRLALLGVGATAASALIAACSENKKTTSEAPATSTGAATSSEPAGPNRTAARIREGAADRADHLAGAAG